MRLVTSLAVVLGIVLAGCGDPPCVPKSCADVGAQCGGAPDGCGGFLSCGACAEGSVCNANRCVACEKRQCRPNVDCGAIDDGCGGTANCGGCSGGLECRQHQCREPCVAKTCAAGQCGDIDDGCGSTVSCGDCGNGQICGLSVENTCGPAPDVCSAGAWERFPHRFFTTRCVACHTGFDDYATVASCNPCEQRISSGLMPPGGLDASERALILQWFQCGSKQ